MALAVSELAAGEDEHPVAATPAKTVRRVDPPPAATATPTAAPAAAAAPAPAAPQVVFLGRSVRGRAITATRLGDPNSPNKALVVGVIHGNEPAGLAVTRVLKRSFTNITGVDLWVVDAFNPDGLHANSRYNAHGVDLNRNFPYGWTSDPSINPGPRPFSEPESRAIRDLFNMLHPHISIWYHQPWDAVLRDPCPGPFAVQRRYAQLVGMPTSCHGANLPGTAIHWENHQLPGSTGMVVEFPGGPLSKRAAMRNARAVVEVTTSASF